jgi:glycosyltransferase involved in cell wall biosynthesis
MLDRSTPSISAVVAAYQAERFIGEALESILTQTRPPDEVVVVDDGSTDGTARELERFADRVRVVRQPNRGYQAAMNRAVGEARGDYVALCGADDIWELRKLEWQEEAIGAHPEVDVFFGHAVAFGRISVDLARPPGRGVLPTSVLRDALVRENVIATPFIVVRRALFERLGPFVENFKGDDYEYWFRCLNAGARFYYDPRVLGRYRRHDGNLTNDAIGLYRAMNLVRLENAALIEDRRLLRSVLTTDFFRVGRLLVDDGRPGEARQEFRRALRYAFSAPSTSARALAWLAVLSLPRGPRERSGRTLVRFSRALDGLRGARRTGGVRPTATP